MIFPEMRPDNEKPLIPAHLAAAVGDGLARPAVELPGIGGEPAGMIDYSNDRYGICPIVQPVIMPNRVHLILTVGGNETGRARPSPTFKDGRRIKNKTPLNGWERAGITRFLLLSRFFPEICKFWRRGRTMKKPLIPALPPLFLCGKKSSIK
jgi:hypothetical protein